MKKKLLVIFIILVCLLIVFFVFIKSQYMKSARFLCDTKYAKFVNKDIEDAKPLKEINPEMEMKVIEESITRTGANFLVIHNTQNFSYGKDFTICKKDNGVWKELAPLDFDYVVIDIAYISTESPCEIKVNWEDLYGKLPNGEYKIVKQYSIDKYYSAEFSIE